MLAYPMRERVRCAPRVALPLLLLACTAVCTAACTAASPPAQGAEPALPGSGSSSNADNAAPSSDAGAASAGASGQGSAGSSSSAEPPVVPIDAGAGASGGAADAGAAQSPGVDAGDQGGSSFTCAVEGHSEDGCVAQLCTFEGDTFVSLRNNSYWQAGGLSWVASVCEHPLGWPSAATSDGLLIVFPLTLKDLSELDAGAPVFVYWGNWADPPVEPQLCQLERATPLPACPETPTPPKHESLRGCRGPSDAGCAVCRELGDVEQYRSRSGDGVGYNSTSISPPPGSCSSTLCPACATCSYVYEQASRELPARPECEPCGPQPGIDPCFDLETCGCWCAKRAVLSAACPTVLL